MPDAPGNAPVLEVRELRKAFGAARAVDGVSFAVGRGEILVVVGGSGCGKTTTLRCIAGLETIDGGEILLDGKVIASARGSVPPERRGIGMVFQSYALWPHKTVAQNVAYGLQRGRVGAAEAASRVSRILDQVGLRGLEHRLPSTLSGGQQQRVALARSAVLQPRVLLLDEPLSNLDATLREQMRDDLRDMIGMFGMTAIHITHDQSEAMALADQLVCMRSGRVEQAGPPQELYRRPANRYVAGFIGASSFLEGRVAAPATGAAVELGAGLIVHVAGQSLPPAGERCLIAVRPEAVTLLALCPKATRRDAGDTNRLIATVTRKVFLGPHSDYWLDLGGQRLKAFSDLELRAGDVVTLSIDARKVACLNPSE